MNSPVLNPSAGTVKVLYLSIGLRARGGIARYSRYQIRALRELLGLDNVVVLSLIGRGSSDFETDFSADYEGRGLGLAGETQFLLKTIARCRAIKPTVLWSDHIRFLPNLILSHLFIPSAFLLVNVYGEELWSGARLSLNKQLLRRSSLVLSDCHFSAEFIEGEYGIGRDQIRVVWDCVDLDQFCPKQRRPDFLRSLGVPTAEENRYLLTLGRIDRRSQYKGYDRLLDVLGTLREHKNIIFLFAGDGDYRPILQQRVRDQQLDGRAFFLGAIPESQLVDVYNSCDVFALVSDRGKGRGEGIPLTPLEAAACAKPIIVGNEDGSREAVIDGVTGRLVSPRDPAALREAILELLLGTDVRMRMGRAGRQRIEAEFSYEVFRNKLANIVSELSRGSIWQQQVQLG